MRPARHGECGAELSAVVPHLAEIADDIAIVKSVHTDQFNHAPAELLVYTGSPRSGRPSMGAWVTYGLGSLAEEKLTDILDSLAGHPVFEAINAGQWWRVVMPISETIGHTAEQVPHCMHR